MKLLTIGLLVLSPCAVAGTIDFESQTCSNAEATITASAEAGPCVFSMPMGPSWVIRNSGGRGNTFWEIQFENLVSNVTVEMFDKTADDDRLFLRTFDQDGDILAETFYDSLGPNRIRHTLNLPGPGVSFARYGVDPALGSGSGIFNEYVSWESPTPVSVPLPFSGLLLLGGLSVLALLSTRNWKNAAPIQEH